MNANTRNIGKVYYRVQRVDSTNNFLSRLLEQKALPEGLVISADEQTEGKGQYGRSWHAESGMNVLFSTILYPRFLGAARQFCLNMAVSNALRRALSPYVPSLRVKWPNDLMKDEHKLAGVLCRSSIQHNHLQHCIIGVGCNVNQTRFPQFKRPAISLKLISGEQIDRRALEQTIFEEMSLQYKKLLALDVEAILEEYNNHLWQKGEKQWFEIREGQSTAARLMGIDEKGDLELCLDGKKKVISNENISYLR